MPRYYLDIHDDVVAIDHEGLELADDKAAMARALVEARGLAAESVRNGRLVRSHRIEVRGADRKRLGAVRFDEAVAISRPAEARRLGDPGRAAAD